MNWKRIDNVRNIRDYAHDSVFGRVYGLDGELWPRISSQIFKTKTGKDECLIFTIKRKDSSQEAWYDHPLPVSLLSDFIDMTKDYENEITK